MGRFGGLTAPQAEVAVLERYRDLIYRDTVWHWAMLKIYRDFYRVKHPELVQPPAEYSNLVCMPGPKIAGGAALWRS